MATHTADVAIVGAGILGVAHAYALARRGRSVVVFERSPQAAGASVRNFGMIWPIGQPAGRMHEMALRSRDRWAEVLTAAHLPYFPTGSPHVVFCRQQDHHHPPTRRPHARNGVAQPRPVGRSLDSRASPLLPDWLAARGLPRRRSRRRA